MNIKIAYKKNAHQAVFHSDVTAKYLHLSSGFAGGKTFGLAMKGFQLSYINQHFAGGCVVPSIADYKKDMLPVFHDILAANNIKYKYHHTDKWYRFPWSRGTLQIASAEKSLRGPNWGYALFNEVTLMDHVRYKEGIGRVRVKGAPCPQIASSGTPEGTDHWLHEQFIEKPLPNSRIIYGDTRDNAENLAPDYIQSLEDSYDSVMIDAYLRGMFVNMNGNRFYYAYDPKRNTDKTLERISGLEVLISLDFNVDPMCATMWHVLPVRNMQGERAADVHGVGSKRLIAFDQIELGGPMGANTKNMCDAIKARGYHPDDCTIYPDPAGKARSTTGEPNITILRQEGFDKIKYRNVAPQFRRRQLATNNLLEKGLVVCHPDNCNGIRKDWESCERDEVTGGKIKTNPKLTHHSDGFDYMIDLEFPLSGQKPDSRIVKFR